MFETKKFDLLLLWKFVLLQGLCLCHYYDSCFCYSFSSLNSINHQRKLNNNRQLPNLPFNKAGHAAPLGFRRDSSPAHRGNDRYRLFVSTKMDSINGDSKAMFYQDQKIQEADIVVCGGGPAGLLTAIMLAQKYEKIEKKLTKTTTRRPKIVLFDRLNEPASPDDETVWNDIAKFYLIGLGNRGQAALRTFDVWDDVAKRCVPVLGRMDWTPESPNKPVERIFDKKTKRVTTQILPRDKLVSVLYSCIKERYKDWIEFYHGHEVEPIDFDYNDGKSVLLQVFQCNPTTEGEYKQNKQQNVLDSCDVNNAFYWTTNFLIAADGTVRTIANAMELEDKKIRSEMNIIQKLVAKQRPFTVKRYIDDNKRVYKSIPMKIPSNWRPDLNYSARTKGGQINFDALPATKNGDYCGLLLVKYDDPLVQQQQEGSTPSALRSRMDESLPQFSQLIDDDTIATVANKAASDLPAFRYVSPRLHHKNKCVILGDCIHTVKPYFGLGANSALEDVKVLSDSLDAVGFDNTAKAVQEFTKRRAKDAKTLVRLSRNLDRPGKLGFITFLLPIILDGIFSNIAPSIFSPNVITMLQREDLTFQQVARIKRKDRAVQVGILLGGFYGISMLFKQLVMKLAQITGKSKTLVVGGLLTSFFLMKLVSKIVQKPTTIDTESSKPITIQNSQQTFIKPAKLSKR